MNELILFWQWWNEYKMIFFIKKNFKGKKTWDLLSTSLSNDDDNNVLLVGLRLTTPPAMWAFEAEPATLPADTDAADTPIVNKRKANVRVLVFILSLYFLLLFY
jgi:hypothetical protein